MAQFFLVLRPELISDERGNADGISDENRVERIGEIENDAVGGDPDGPDIAKKLHVIANREDGGRNVGDELADAVARGFRENVAVEFGFSEANRRLFVLLYIYSYSFHLDLYRVRQEPYNSYKILLQPLLYLFFIFYIYYNILFL